MALNPDGSWYPSLPDPLTGNLGFGELLNGTGAPSDDSGNNGDVYVDLSSGDVYQKTNNSWTIITGGGGGGTIQVIAGTVDDPNGTHTPADQTKGAIYYKRSATDTKLWAWNTSSLAWNQFIG